MRKSRRNCLRERRFRGPIRSGRSPRVALVHAAVRRLLRRQPYRVLGRRAVQHALQRSQFRIRSVHRQFVLPMWLHRTLGSRRVTTQLENMLDRVGLLRRLGTPVTVCAERAMRERALD